MSKNLTHTITYPKPAEAAWADIVNPAYQEGKLLDGGASNVVVSIGETDAGGANLVLERDNPVVGVPSAVKKIVGESAHVIETIAWSAPDADGVRTAQHQTAFVGTPIAMTGSMQLTPAGQTSQLTLTATFKSSLPLIGGKLEDTALKETVKAMDAEQAFSASFRG